MRRWISLLFVLALVMSACAPIAPPVDQPVVADDAVAGDVVAAEEALSADPAVTVGTLDNGLTYYIRQNDEPMNRAELWLVINAGSIQEEEDQLGLAHFLEHMLFNGTENFPEFGVVDFLESTGMEFGPDVNAHTSFDETVYTIQVPTEDEATVEKGLQVLADWAGRATLAEEAIDQERDVIVEEWRLRQQTAQGRISEELLDFLLGDSRYSERLPIGDMDVVRTAPREAFTRYYEDWYRPDLMSVIAVGDFDVETMEEMIIEQFSPLTMPADPKERPTYDLPEREGTHFKVVTDPEASDTRLVAFILRPANPIQTVEDLREDVVADLFYIMLNDRLDEIARMPDAPFLAARAGTSGLARPVSAAVISAQLQEEKALDAMESLITEIERVRRHGFTETELARAEQELLKWYETLYNERENRASREFAQDLEDNFLMGEAIPSIDAVYEMINSLLPNITLDEVNAAASLLADDDNRLIYLTGPEKEVSPLPSEEDLASVVASVESLTIDPYVDSVSASELITDTLEPAAIVAEAEIADIGVQEIILENGVRVLLKKTDFKDDEIVFNAVSPGGSSLVSNEDFPEASIIDDVVNESGVGEFPQSELVKLLAGKSITAVPYIRELSEGMEGKTTAADLETLFQLIHLYFTAPRADEDAFEVYQTKKLTELQNRAQDPMAALSDAFNEALYGDTIRRGELPIEEVESLELDRAFEIYQDRFADAGDWSFIFAGNFDEDNIISLTQTYLGTLPTRDREESWKDVAPDLPTQVVESDVYQGEGERSVVQLVFTGPVEASAQSELELDATAGVLDIMLREKLREELGGVYSVGAGGFMWELPDPSYLFIVSFATDPQRVDELVTAMFEEIEDLQNNGPSTENVAKVIAQQVSSHEEEMETNKYWSETLKEYVFYGDQKLATLEADYVDQIQSLDAETIQAAAQEYLQEDRYVKVVLYPESYDPDSQ